MGGGHSRRFLRSCPHAPTPALGSHGVTVAAGWAVFTMMQAHAQIGVENRNLGPGVGANRSTARGLQHIPLPDKRSRTASGPECTLETSTCPSRRGQDPSRGWRSPSIPSSAAQTCPGASSRPFRLRALGGGMSAGAHARRPPMPTGQRWVLDRTTTRAWSRRMRFSDSHSHSRAGPPRSGISPLASIYTDNLISPRCSICRALTGSRFSMPSMPAC